MCKNPDFSILQMLNIFGLNWLKTGKIGQIWPPLDTNHNNRFIQKSPKITNFGNFDPSLTPNIFGLFGLEMFKTGQIGHI